MYCIHECTVTRDTKPYVYVRIYVCMYVCRFVCVSVCLFAVFVIFIVIEVRLRKAMQSKRALYRVFDAVAGVVFNDNRKLRAISEYYDLCDVCRVSESA